MKKQIIISLSAVAAGIILFACGDDVTKVSNVTNEVSGMEVVASADSLGKCDSASVGKMVFASDENAAYVCADSGWVPLSQKASDGKSCTAEKLSDSSGYKIVCGGDSVGVVKNGLNGEDGSDGKNGEKGEKGESGENGASCMVEKLSDGSGYKVVCDGDSVGVVLNGSDGNGCSLTDNGDGTVSQVCGADTITLYKAFCGGSVYDPEKAFCSGDILYSCGGKAYNPSSQICDARDFSVYGFVAIGSQVWMSENLNYAYLVKTAKLDSLSFCYENSADNCETYGRLYTWAAAMDSAAVFSDDGKDCGHNVKCSASGQVRGVCPEGWHLPTTTEWDALRDFVANSLFDGKTDSVGYALKSTSGWNDYNGKSGNGSDVFGFNALPAGDRTDAGSFYLISEYAIFWSSTEYNKSFLKKEFYSFGRSLGNDNTTLNSSEYVKGGAYPVRCVKD